MAATIFPATVLGEPPRLASVAALRADPAQLERITVCTRPFRGKGPRIEAEQVGTKLVVHNYGHGGSGWSLSWGAAAVVVSLVMTAQPREVAVIGCGAMGLTSAIALQRAGVRVILYARDLPADTRSTRATGLWTPDARVALQGVMDDDFAGRWEAMARTSFHTYASMLNLPGDPIERHTRYLLSQAPPDEAYSQDLRADELGFARLEDRIADLYPAPVDYGPGAHPFPSAYCRSMEAYRFNIAVYARTLEEEFRQRGGVLQRAEFHSLAEVQRLPEPVIVQCTGYGARALLQDDTVIPVRGQIAWLPAQPRLPYSLTLDDLNLVPRNDGTVVQWGARGDATGWDDPDETPDPAEAASGLGLAAQLCAGTRFSPVQDSDCSSQP